MSKFVQESLHSTTASGSSELEGASTTLSRKTWKTPTVITSEMEDVEGGGATGPETLLLS
jgi:hypothetical protein